MRVNGLNSCKSFINATLVLFRLAQWKNNIHTNNYISGIWYPGPFQLSNLTESVYIDVDCITSSEIVETTRTSASAASLRILLVAVLAAAKRFAAAAA